MNSLKNNMLENNNIVEQELEHDEQYSLGKILAIWASVTVPMGLILFVVTPWVNCSIFPQSDDR